MGVLWGLSGTNGGLGGPIAAYGGLLGVLWGMRVLWGLGGPNGGLGGPIAVYGGSVGSGELYGGPMGSGGN